MAMQCDAWLEARRRLRAQAIVKEANSDRHKHPTRKQELRVAHLIAPLPLPVTNTAPAATLELQPKLKHTCSNHLGSTLSMCTLLQAHANTPAECLR